MAQQITIYKQQCKMIVSISFRIKAVVITFRQSTGQNIFHLRQPVPETIF